MPIEINCKSCNSSLRIGDEHAGKKARCPSCQGIVNVPAASAPAAANPFAGIGDPAPKSPVVNTPAPENDTQTDSGGFPNITPAGQSPGQKTAEVSNPFSGFGTPAGGSPSPSGKSAGAPTQPKVDSAAANPYAAASSASQFDSGMPLDSSVFRPLQESKMMIQIVAWFLIVAGVLYCITIIGAIIGWLPIWLGMCLRNASQGVETGMQTGSRDAFFKATSNLATFFKILGIVSLIYFGLIALWILFIVVAAIGAVLTQ